jgi:hypothetical protein
MRRTPNSTQYPGSKMAGSSVCKLYTNGLSQVDFPGTR